MSTREEYDDLIESFAQTITEETPDDVVGQGALDVIGDMSAGYDIIKTIEKDADIVMITT